MAPLVTSSIRLNTSTRMPVSSRKRSRTQYGEFGAYPDDNIILEDPVIETSFSPRMNLYKHEDPTNMMTAILELPGLTSSDITIDLLHDQLTISGESPDRRPQGEGWYTSHELPYGKFSRVLSVPLGMKPEDFKARMENGLLTLTFPRDPPKQTPHRIPIK